MEGEPPPQQTYQHVAFAVSEADLPLYETRLRALGVAIHTAAAAAHRQGGTVRLAWHQ